MFKKNPINILASIGVFIAILLIYILFFTVKKEVSDALKAIPLDTGALIEVKNYEALTKKIRHKTVYWEALSKRSDFKKIEQVFLDIDTILDDYPQFRDILDHHSLFVALNVVGKNQLTPLYVVEMGLEDAALVEHNDIKHIFKAERQKRDYQDAEIVHLKRKKRNLFHYTLYKGLFIASPSAIFVEQAIRQIDDNRSLNDDPVFKKIYKTSGRRVDANCFLHFSTFPNLMQQYLSKEHYKKLKQTKFFADWVALDLNTDKDKCFMSGFTHTNDSLNNYLNIFKGQSPKDVDYFEVMPANTSFILSYNLSDFDEFIERKESYFKRRGKNYNDWFESFQNKYGFNIKTVLEEVTEQEMGLFYTQINPLDFTQNAFFLLETSGKSQTLEELLPHLEHWAQNQGKSLNDIITEFTVGEDELIKVYAFPSPNLPRFFLGEAFQNVKSRYFTFIDDYMIFGRSPKELKHLHDQYERHSVMENDSYFKQLNSEINSESTVYLYANVSLSKHLLNQTLSKKTQKLFLKNFEQLKKVQALILQLSGSDDDLLYTNLFLKYNAVLQDKPRTVWESKLDTVFHFKPKIVINHRSKEKEIFLQDLDNNIYLINRNGKVLWKQKISEPILGDVHQIDYYKNNKLQLLFNTASRIYIIDRNGNAVERYPIMLRSKAVTGLSVFDYDKSRDYRIFVPCENRKIYLYDVEGKILPGWKFKKTEALVNTPLQHFRIGTLDFILASDKNRIYILNRKGEERVVPRKNIVKSNNPFFLVYKDNLPYFAGTRPDGHIFMINPKGLVFDKEGLKMTANHKVVFANLNNKEPFDVVYTDRNECKIWYDLKEKKQWKLKGDLSQPLIFNFSAKDKKIGVCSPKYQSLYLYNSNGILYKDFPLRGSTLFSIALLKSKRFNLITGSSDGFLYNYEVP